MLASAVPSAALTGGYYAVANKVQSGYFAENWGKVQMMKEKTAIK